MYIKFICGHSAGVWALEIKVPSSNLNTTEWFVHLSLNKEIDMSFRLKRLVEKFMDTIPERILQGMWEKLSEGRDGDLGEMLEDRCVLLTAAEMLTQMVASIMPPRADPMALAEDRGPEPAEI